MYEWLANLDGDTRVALGIPFAIFVVYLWFRMLIHMMATMNNTKYGLFKTSLLGPIGLLISAMFTEEGNKHRKQFWLYAISFAAIC